LRARKQERRERKQHPQKEAESVATTTTANSSQQEMLERFGVGHVEGSAMGWLVVFPLLALGGCLAFVPGFKDLLVEEREASRSDKGLPPLQVKTRPVHAPFEPKDTNNDASGNQDNTDEEKIGCNGQVHVEP